MYVTELNSPQLLVIYPGRFQPFHKGHHAVFEWLSNKFGRNNVYIATSNKVDGGKSPFSFAEKSYFMQLTGVPADRIVQAAQPYGIESVLQGGNISVANPENTVVIFAVSEKDMAEDPRFAKWTKKDGSPTYFQPLQDIKNTKNMIEHGYIMTVPTFDFTVLGQPMRSASELRKMYGTSDEATRQKIIADLFGKYTREAEQIMNSKIPAAPAEPVAECAGVGVVKDSKDPRYVMATTGDQNDVTGKTLGQMMKGYGLIGRNPANTKQKPVTGKVGQGLKESISAVQNLISEDKNLSIDKRAHYLNRLQELKKRIK